MVFQVWDMKGVAVNEYHVWASPGKTLCVATPREEQSKQNLLHYSVCNFVWIVVAFTYV